METISKLLQAIELGNPVSGACHLAGISPTTLATWLKLADDPDPEYDEYRELPGLIAESNARAQAQFLERTKELAEAKGDWKGPAWILERRWPQQWGSIKTVVNETANNSQPRTVGELRMALRASLELLEGLDDSAPVPAQLTEGKNDAGLG